MPPKEFAVLLFFARARKQSLGPGRDGWIPGREFDNPMYIQHIEQAYHAATGGKALPTSSGFIPLGRDGRVNFEELKQKVTHAVSKIKAHLGASHPARVQYRAARGGKEYGMDLDPAYIDINEV